MSRNLGEVHASANELNNNLSHNIMQEANGTKNSGRNNKRTLDKRTNKSCAIDEIRANKKRQKNDAEKLDATYNTKNINKHNNNHGTNKTGASINFSHLIGAIDKNSTYIIRNINDATYDDEAYNTGTYICEKHITGEYSGNVVITGAIHNENFSNDTCSNDVSINDASNYETNNENNNIKGTYKNGTNNKSKKKKILDIKSARDTGASSKCTDASGAYKYDTTIDDASFNSAHSIEATNNDSASNDDTHNRDASYEDTYTDGGNSVSTNKNGHKIAGASTDKIEPSFIRAIKDSGSFKMPYKNLPTHPLENPEVDKHYATLTLNIIKTLFKKECDCGASDLRFFAVKNRPTSARCKSCHKQISITSNTPLHKFLLPLSYFSYILHDSILQYPKVVTSSEISRKLNLPYKTAYLLKRRIQLVASMLNNKLRESVKEKLKTYAEEHPLVLPKGEDLRPILEHYPVASCDAVVLYSSSVKANKYRSRRFRTEPPLNFWTLIS